MGPRRTSTTTSSRAASRATATAARGTSTRTAARALGTAPRTQLRPAGAGGHAPPPSGPRVGASARRQWILLWIVVAVLALFAARLVQVQVVEAATLAEQGRDTRARVIPLDATRGEIVDASGMVMATSVVRYDVQVDLRQVPAYVRLDETRTAGEEPVILGRGAVEAAKQLAPLLGVDEHELGAQLTGTQGGLRIAREVTPEVREQIEELGINGLTTHSTTKRVYPNGTTAGDLVGWVNNEQNGAAGLEYSLNGDLQGVDGERSYETGVGGTVIPFASQSTVPAQDGPTVHTSIDLDLQYVCQNSVDAQVASASAEFGAAVVQEVKTGRILALCDSGATDPNAPTGSGEIRSVTSPYEPGSTGKILTVASALNEGLITPTSTFTVPDQLTMPNGQTFKDATEHPEHELTTAGILAFSSNTGTVQIGDLMTDAKRVEYMNAFGWGDRTGVELGGERGGTNLDPTQWDGRTRYVTMFGQANQVNLLQITNVMATLGNGGVRLPLHLVDGYSDDAGTFTPAEHGEGVQVVTEQTSDEMLLMLEGVMADQLGTTGKKAAIDGYRVAGKTGTAQIPNTVDGRLTDTAASFVGVAPAEDPEIAVGVIIFRPAGSGTGGGLAAPVFHDVASAALQMLGIPPSGTTETLYELYGDTAE
ncbi:peptidoglycan D,D-transpeptidase FtsI family protein [Serinibacter arcticus]|uniref:Cell division protein FtsI [Peptidoglycan synthetase] n=1 Tax=Serinibacter arcticus TaxID=1655435 RepID=A0A4Z1E1V6_9MICO|nr:penicillin-binding protein 2 [Serinibacter arcticus]TGO05866.1 Cell division protein FtsI [Peptidoglycan synthetase] [Serinibacter arcticus]